MDGFWSAQLLWFLAGVALLLAELAMPGFVMLFFALGAFAAALAAYLLSFGASGQLVVFLAASLAGLALLRRMFLRVFRGRTHMESENTSGLEDPGAGKSAVVTRAMAPGQPGEIKFRGSFWPAQAQENIGEGENVVIIGLVQNDSGTYLVRPARADADNGGR
jgi:inner membrane protein